MLSGRRINEAERRLYETAIEDIDSSDAIAAAGYLYLVTLGTGNRKISKIDESFYILEKLAEKLNLSERLNNVLEIFLDYNVKTGILHFIPESDNSETGNEDNNLGMRQRYMRERNSRCNFVYTVDKEIANYVNFRELPAEYLSFLRLTYTYGKNMYSQIIYYTFFTKGKILPDKICSSIPPRVGKIVFDTSKLRFLQKELNLTDKETSYLLIRFRKSTIEVLGELMNQFSENSTELYMKLLDVSKKEFIDITRPDSKLRQFGFISDKRILNPALIDCIEAQDLSLYFSDCIKTQDLSEVYELDSFCVPKKNTDIYKSLLRSDNSVSVLLYGAPGSGKTEYAKALVKGSGMKAVIFKNEAEVLNKEDVLGRLNCLLSLNRKDTVLIVDEADSLLSTSMMTFLGPVQSPKSKGVVNKMLESSKNKVIWIVNYKSQIDESTLRRFTVSYKFEPMSSKILENIALKKLENLEIGEDTKNQIIKLLSQYKVTGASVDNLVKTISSMNQKDDSLLLENIGIVLKDNSALLHGEAKMRTAVKDSYDMSVLNTSVSAPVIIKMLENAEKYAEKHPGQGAVRMLFYGLSGTGKTEFARFIGQSLGKEILLKRASDIFDKYVGGTEQNISKAFHEAAKNGQILLFDEADSFFSDRNNAVRNYERTQVNEFLTQLEEFPGIVICTTNLKNIMDPAMNRRFHLTVDFKALTEEGISKLLNRFFEDYDFDEAQIHNLADYKTVTPGDFGRLSDTIKFMDQEMMDGNYILEQLEQIQKEKTGEEENSHGKIGFFA